MIILLSILMVLVILIVAISVYFTHIVIHPKTYSHDYVSNHLKESKEADLVWLDSLPKEEVSFQSYDGLKLFGEYYRNKDSKKTIIFAHGITWTLQGGYKYMDMFYKRGFNVFLYDHRNHGNSQGNHTILGYYEKLDLKAAVDYIVSKTGKDTLIGTHGESMGAATVLQHGAIDDRLSFIVADCPFSDLYAQLAYRMKVEYRLPAFPLLDISSMIAKIWIGASFKEVSPIKTLHDIKAKVLFVHGVKDDYIPCQMSMDMQKLLPGSDILLVDEGKHATAVIADKAAYDSKIETFLAGLRSNNA